MAVLILRTDLFVLLGGLPWHRGLSRRGSGDLALARHRATGGLVAVTSPRVRANADAVAHPYGGGPQYAAQLAALRQVKSLMRPQREVLVIAREHAATVRETVVRIRPGGRLLRILTGGADLRREI